MGKQKSDQIKKKLAISLIVLFVVSVTVAAVSAVPSDRLIHKLPGGKGGFEATIKLTSP
jgi:hypothetical protein